MISRKGQMFVIGAIIIIVGLVMMKGLFASYSSGSRNDNSYDLFLLHNLETEYEHVASMNYLYGSNMLVEFSNYLSSQTNAGVLYVYSERNGGAYLVNIGNYLGYNITVTLPGFNQNLDNGQNAVVPLSVSSVDFTYGSRSVPLDIDADAFLFYSMNLGNGEIIKEGEYRIE